MSCTRPTVSVTCRPDRAPAVPATAAGHPRARRSSLLRSHPNVSTFMSPPSVRPAPGAAACRTITDPPVRPGTLRAKIARCLEQPRPMTADDIAAVEVVEELDVAAGGEFAVVVRRVDPAAIADASCTRATCSSIDLAGGSRSRGSSPQGTVRDTSPRIAPDGVDGRVPRVAIRSTTTHPAELASSTSASSTAGAVEGAGARRGRARASAASSEIAWSPDGVRLAFVAAGRSAAHPDRRERPPIGSAAWRASKLPTLTARPAHHAHRLAVGRGGPPRPLVAPVRDRRSTAGARRGR